MTSALANECFNVREIFEMSKDVEALFEEPGVGEEKAEICGVPHALDVSKISVEVFFDSERAVSL